VGAAPLHLTPSDVLLRSDDPVGLAAAVRGADDVVPADGTVLVRGAATVPTALAQVAVRSRQHLLPVVYDGADLAEVAALQGMPVDEVVRRHTGATYRVAFLGFAPGFAYLDGLDPALVVPRLATPRVRVPALSVGITGARSCLYPGASPGGWRLLGRAVGVTPFRADADPPALLVAGDTVRFLPVDREPTLASAAAEPLRDTGSLQVLSPGVLALVVDRGRVGWAHLGVPRSGALDLAALAAANLLLGNASGAAGLEVLVAGPVLAGVTGVAVATPAGASIVRAVDGVVDLRELPGGALRAWVALPGGLDITPVLGSRSADLLGGLGPAPLRAGDRLPLGDGGGGSVPAPVPAVDGPLRVLPGPDAALLERALGRWRVLPASDRTALRLEPVGRVPVAHEIEVGSVGLVPGALQLPPDGRLVLALGGHPSTGGYPLVGVVGPGQLAALAQARAGDELVVVPA